MATIDLRDKLTNEASRMEEIGRFIVFSDVVTLDQYFTINQSGVLISHVTAKYIHVGTTGDIAYETPYTLNNVPVIAFIKAAVIGRHPILCRRILSTSSIGNTTATNLTWLTGE